MLDRDVLAPFRRRFIIAACADSRVALGVGSLLLSFALEEKKERTYEKHTEVHVFV